MTEYEQQIAAMRASAKTVKVRPRDLKPGDLWLHWTGTKHVALPVVDVKKAKQFGGTVYKVRLDVPNRDRNYISRYRTVQPTGWVEIVKENDGPS